VSKSWRPGQRADHPLAEWEAADRAEMVALRCWISRLDSNEPQTSLATPREYDDKATPAGACRPTGAADGWRELGQGYPSITPRAREDIEARYLGSSKRIVEQTLSEKTPPHSSHGVTGMGRSLEQEPAPRVPFGGHVQAAGSLRSMAAILVEFENAVCNTTLPLLT